MAEQNIAGAPQRDPVNATAFPIGGPSPGSTTWARMKSAMQTAFRAVFAVWGIGQDLPTGGHDGDWYLRTGTTAPGIYRRVSGTWNREFAGGGDGTDATARAGVAANTARLNAIPVYAGRLAVWPPNVRRHSDFQRTFQSTLSGLAGTLATDAGSTGTRFTNVFRILTRNAAGTVVQLHTQGWSATNDERQTIEWEVSAAEFNQLGTEVTSNGLEVWGEFRAVYGGGVDELRGRTNPVFIDFGEQNEWPATRGEIPEQRVLRDVAVPSADTRGKLVLNDDLAYITRAERDVTTAATATFTNYTASDFVGDFADSEIPDASANIGKWYWNQTRLTAFRSFRDDTLGAIWTAIDVNRVVISGDYRGQWPSDLEATKHIQQVGDFYSDLGGVLRAATAYTPEQSIHLRDEFDRIVTENDALYSVAALQWDVSPGMLPARTVEAIATTYTITLQFPLPVLKGLFYRVRTGVEVTDLRPWVHGVTTLPAVVLDSTKARGVLDNIPEGQDHFEVRLEFFTDQTIISARVGVTSRRVGFAGAAGALTDDAVLDLAKPTRTAGDRGKVLGTSGSDENALALLDPTAGAEDATARAAAMANAAAISTLRTESRSGDDLQSITVASLASLNSALTAQATAATALELVFSADVTKDGTTYSAGDVVYVSPRSAAIEARFNVQQGGTDATARAAAAAAQASATTAQQTADRKADAFTLSSADLRFAGQRILGLSTARAAQLNRTPADGGTARQVWSKGPANEKAAWRDPTGGSAAGTPDSDIGGAENLGAGNAWSAYNHTEDLDRDRYYQFYFQAGTGQRRFMRSSRFKGSDFLDLTVQSDEATFTQGSENDVIGLSLPRPNIDGVRTLYIARSATARRILMRVNDDYNVIKLIKLGGIPGPKGDPGTAAFTKKQEIAVLTFLPDPATIAFESSDDFIRQIREISIHVPNAELLTGDVWVETWLQGQRGTSRVGSITGQRVKWTPLSGGVGAVLFSAGVAESIANGAIGSDNNIDLRSRFFDAAAAGNEIERVGVNIPLVDLRAATDATARAAAAAAQATADAATTPDEAAAIAAARFTNAEKAKLANLYRDNAPPSAAVINWDVDSNEVLTLAPTQNFTLNMSGGVSGQIATLRVLQDTTGSRLMTFGSGIVRDGRPAPVLSTKPGAHDNIFFQKRGALWVYLQAILDAGAPAPSFTTRGQKIATFGVPAGSHGSNSAIRPASRTYESGIPSGFANSGTSAISVPELPPSYSVDGLWAVATLNGTQVSASKLTWGPGALLADDSNIDQSAAVLQISSGVKLSIAYNNRAEVSSVFGSGDMLFLKGSGDVLPSGVEVEIYLGGVFAS